MGRKGKSQLQKQLDRELRRFLFKECPEKLRKGYSAERGAFARDLYRLGIVFGNDHEDKQPKEKYEDCYFDYAYYLRYGLGYACEYAFLYEVVFEDMKRRGVRISKKWPLKVVSFGSGGEIDKWALLYAASEYVKHSESSYEGRLRYEGVDRACWRVKISCSDGHFSEAQDREDSCCSSLRLSCEARLEKLFEKPEDIDIYFFPRMLKRSNKKTSKKLSEALRDAIHRQQEKPRKSTYVMIAHLGRAEKSAKTLCELQSDLIGELGKSFNVTDVIGEFLADSSAKSSGETWISKLEKISEGGGADPCGLTYGFRLKEEEKRYPYCDEVVFPSSNSADRSFRYPSPKGSYSKHGNM